MICESAGVAPCSCSDAARQRLTPTSAAFATLVFTLQRAVARDGANAELPAGWTLHHKHLATTTAAETDAAASDSSTSSSNSSSNSSDGTAADELRAVTAAYFSSFYSKSCCFQDLRPYLGVLLDLQRQQQSDVAADVAAADVAAVMITWLREQADSAVFSTDVIRPPTEAIDEVSSI
jgi:N-acetyltransferase B complex (NatB) non catalytic subunit